MSTMTEYEPRTYRGTDLDELLPKIRAELGPDAIVLRQREGLDGGVGGFFQRRCVEIVARRGMPGVDAYDERAASPAAPEPQSPGIREIMRGASPFIDQLHAAEAAPMPVVERAPQPAAPHRPDIDEQPLTGAYGTSAYATSPGDPAVAVRPEPTVPVRPEPAVPVSPEPAAVRPEPYVPVRPEPAAVRPEPYVPVRSEPAVEAPQPAVAVPPEPAVEAAIPVRPEPAVEVPQPAVPVRPEPAVEVPQPAVPVRPEPAAQVLEPALPVRPEPAVAVRPDSAAVAVRAEPEPEPAPERDLAARGRAAVAHEGTLIAAGIAPQLVAEVIDAAVSHIVPLDPKRALKHVLRTAFARRIPLMPPAAPGGRAIAFVGAGGSGKTHCVARLASAYARRSDLGVTVMSLATPAHRAGLGELIDIEVLDARLSGAARDVRNDALTVIDTPAVSPAATGEVRALAGRLKGLGRPEVHVTVPATLSSTAVRRLLDGYAPLRPTAIVLTHLDEVTHAGPVIDEAIARAIPISFMSDGSATDGFTPADATALAAQVLA